MLRARVSPKPPADIPLTHRRGVRLLLLCLFFFLFDVKTCQNLFLLLLLGLLPDFHFLLIVSQLLLQLLKKSWNFVGRNRSVQFQLIEETEGFCIVFDWFGGRPIGLCSLLALGLLAFGCWSIVVLLVPIFFLHEHLEALRVSVLHFLFLLFLSFGLFLCQ